MTTLVQDFKSLFDKFIATEYEKTHSDVIKRTNNWNTASRTIVSMQEHEEVMALLLYELHTRNRKNVVHRYFARYKLLRNRVETKALEELQQRINSISEELRNDKS